MLKGNTAYHPQTHGQAEIVNKAPEAYLRCFVGGGGPNTWAWWLPWAEFSYNASPHCSMKISLFKVQYERDPPQVKSWTRSAPVLGVGRGETTVNKVEELLKGRDAILNDLHFNLMRAQHKMRQAADRKRRDELFEVNNFVNTYIYNLIDKVCWQGVRMRSWLQSTMGHFVSPRTLVRLLMSWTFPTLAKYTTFFMFKTGC